MNEKALTKIQAILMVLIILASFLIGYFTAPKPEVEKPIEKLETIIVIDSSGRYVKIVKPVERIVTLTTDAAEVIVALNASSLVVGVSEYIVNGEAEFWGRLAKLPSVGTCFKPDYERIIELKPDIVISYVRWPGLELEEKLEPAGIKVVRLNFYKPTTMDTEIKTLGLILGREEEANNICTWQQKTIELIQDRLKKAEEKLRTYIEGYRIWSTAGPGSGWYELTVMGGLIPIGEFTIPYPKVDAEWVIEQNPDVIIKFASSTVVPKTYTANSSKLLEKVIDEIKARPGLDLVSAVKNNRIYVIHADIASSPSYPVAIAYIAKLAYPELFKDLDPKSIHAEYLEFLNLEYKGFWVYPEP